VAPFVGQFLPQNRTVATDIELSSDPPKGLTKSFIPNSYLKPPVVLILFTAARSALSFRRRTEGYVAGIVESGVAFGQGTEVRGLSERYRRHSFQGIQMCLKRREVG